jgi:hypothetical protein
MNKFDTLDEFMRQTDATLIVGPRQMFFEDGEWVITTLPPYGKRRQVIDRFLDAVPNALSDALKCLNSDEAVKHGKG